MPIRSTRALGLGILTALSAPDVAPAQGGAPAAFAEAMEDALAEAGSAASLVRCTALFRAFRLYAGTGTEVGTTAAEHETGLAVAAAVVWQDEAGTAELETAFEAIVPMVSAATDLFLLRMSNNQDAGGNVLDEALQADITYCDTLHDEIAQAGRD